MLNPTIKIDADIKDNDLKRMLNQKLVAIDCEMTGLNPHKDKLCLVQVFDGSSTVNFVKTDDWKNSTNLKILLESEKVLKIFHFAVMDCSFLTINLHCHIKNVYCTKIASKLGNPNRGKHSLAYLVKEFLDVDLDKTTRETNWCTDNLTEEQIVYATQDVLYLIKLRNHLEEQITNQGKLTTGGSLPQIDNHLQNLVPDLVQLLLNGWDFGLEDETSVFGK